ncbi:MULTISPECIES: RagB/SusD family nutrient uptake outer membrane protein [Bacteroides]|jgi:hypothetical protein|uniref:RagB/SusD family nutrient uptake outer membrane protein n=1 Tax=Bacteroides TaxID=816 RepID=UPI00082086F7|nr:MULTISPECIES: RagB/SusD family nutrient uptake outer membrane protein [Bacteroides]SCH38483.1 SusD family [uncultured Bacteroides sp.]
MNKTIYKISLSAVAATMLSFQACSLEEVNPGGFLIEDLTLTSEGYTELINQCYFSMERGFYGTDGWMAFTEGDTDLWTYRANDANSYQQFFWFYAGAAANTTYTDNIWNNAYDGIGSCNTAISLADKAPFTTEEERNAKVAEARFLRAVYYFNLVEQFGAVTKLVDVPKLPNYAPTRTEPLEIYKDVIIPDLEFAATWLPVGDHSTTTTPTKKSAMAFLAKACLQTYEYGSIEYLQIALDNAKKLITDCESGGNTYMTYMYPTYAEVFKEDNNFENKEALWKHRWAASSSAHGSSNGNYKLNRNDEYFLCNLTKFGARQDSQESRLTWEGSINGIFMPTQHLLSLYVQTDGTLDPRYHQSFTTEWNANQNYSWTSDDCTNFRKDRSVEGKSLTIGDLAVKFITPQDNDYETEKAKKATSDYLIVDYADVYDAAKKNVIMKNGSNENQLRYFYPSLNKHNSSNYYVASASKKRNGNLNATFIMRMPEVYFIAAEADLYLNGGTNALGYLNKVRLRANAKALQETVDVRTILDERARELCGEYCRFYDLKRTGMLKNKSYLEATHPDLAQYFEPNYALRPISTNFTATISNGAEYQNPGY